MTTAAFSNIDRALLEDPENLRNPSREYLQKMLVKYLPENRKKWAKELKWAKGYETLLVKLHKTRSDGLVIDLVMQKINPDVFDHETQAEEITRRTNGIDSLFHQMHYVAYVEGLINTANPEIVDEKRC